MVCVGDPLTEAPASHRERAPRLPLEGLESDQEQGSSWKVVRLTALFGIFPLPLVSRHIYFHFFFPLPLSQRAETLIFTLVDKVKPEKETLVSVSECECECECCPV